MKRGTTVRLVVEENPVLHGQLAIIKTVTEWGAFVACESAATGEFRAAFEEMESIAEANGIVAGGSGSDDAAGMGYTGNSCAVCGSVRVVRNGTCELCLECGSTSGCS